MSDPRIDGLVEEFMQDVEEIVNELSDGSVPEEDLIQEGCLGILEAARLLFPGEGEETEIPVSVDRTVRDSIRDAVERALRENSGARESDLRLVAQVELLEKSISRLTEELGTKPNIDEIANDMEISQEKVLEILKLTGENEPDDAFFPAPERKSGEAGSGEPGD